MMACKLYIRIRIREVTIEEKIQQVLSYVQEGLADIQKENILENLEGRLLEYKTVEEFLADIRKKFGKGDKKSVKVAELKRIEQGGKMIEEFIQEFRRAARGSGYKGRPLVEEFKRGMNETIRRKLMEVEHQLGTVEQQYKRAIILDRN